MKGLVFLADGMADEALAELGGKTPVEYARTPYMDALAAGGVNGTFFTLPAGLPTSSDVANMSVLGLAPECNYPGRGPIEAVSQGIVFQPGDIAWRCNLVTVSPDGILRDYSAGHIEPAVSERLMLDLQAALGSEAATFHPGVSYRNLLMLHGDGFSAGIDYHKPDSSQDLPLAELGLTPLDGMPAAARTVDFLNALGEKAHAFLIDHPLYREGKSKATHIWPWSPGHKPELGTFAERYAGRRGAIVSAVDVIKGLGKCTGMTVAEVPGATGFLDTNYAGKVEAALRLLRDHDFVYLHVEAIDECSHLGDLKLKLRAIEDFDEKIVGPVVTALAGRQDIRFALLPDHPVPIRLRKHTRTPVPLAVCGAGIAADAVPYYSELRAPEGALGELAGDRLVKLLLGLA